MAVYRNIQIGFWQDPFIMKLTPEEPFEPMSPETSEVTESLKQNEEVTSVGRDVFTFYEQNFGVLSPYTAEELIGWTQDLSEELVLQALKIAYENNKRTLAYVKGILRDWHGKGYAKLREVEEAAVRFRMWATG